ESHIAYCINRRHPTPEYSEADTEEARSRITMAKDEAENGELDRAALEENEKQLIDRIAQKRFDQAMFYKTNNHYRAAEVYFALIKEKYPKTKWAEKSKKELEDMRKRGIDNTIWNKVFK